MVKLLALAKKGQSGLIGWLMNLLTVHSTKNCAYYISATTQNALILSIYF